MLSIHGWHFRLLCACSRFSSLGLRPPPFTSDKYFTSQDRNNCFNDHTIFLPARAAASTQHSVAGFWRCITDPSTGAGIRDATFFFDSSPCAWYLRGRDYCRHPWKRKGVFTDAKTHPTMVRHRSTCTDGDARLCAACERRAASTVSSKSRHLSTETDLPTVSTVHLSRRGRDRHTRGSQRKGVKTCLEANIG